MAALALAWLLSLEDVTAVVVGPTRVTHLDHVRAALGLELAPDDADHLRGLFV
jgi:aryl-alcohol dehydrogenase-like predicted oxidoreductase